MTKAAGCATDLLTAIAHIGQAVEVAAGAWDRLGREQIAEAYSELERARKKMAIIDAEYMKALREHHHISEPGVARAFTDNAGSSRAEGRKRAAAYRRLHQWEPSSFDSGNPEYMPEVRAKVEQGVIGAEAVEKIDRAIGSMPGKIQEELTKKADVHIAELVEKIRVDDLGQLAVMLRGLFGIDDPYTDEDRKHKRAIYVGRQGYDGMSKISGHLTPHLAALIERLAADHACPGGLLDDAADDRRIPSQRLHDAVEAALAAGFGRGPDPTGGEGWGLGPSVAPDGDGPGGTPSDGDEHGGAEAGNEKRGRKRGRLVPARGTTSIVAVTTLAELLALNGTASTDTNVQMTVADAVEHGDARNLFLQVLDFRGETLYFGRSRRCGSMSQYLALFGEEGMSSAPMSSAPAASCHMHHVTSWGAGGTSDLPNYTFVDPKTHANTDDSRTNPDKWWSRRGNGPDEPRVVWNPPASMDTERTPSENSHPGGWCNPGRVLRRTNRGKSGGRDGRGDRGRERGNDRGRDRGRGEGSERAGKRGGGKLPGGIHDDEP